MQYINRSIIQKTYKTRITDSHKGDNGKILCIGGSEDYIGAPYLAANSALSALRTGADIVTVAAPKRVAYAINSLNPDIITKKFDCIYFTEKQIDEILNLSESYDSILIGPGIGQKDETKLFVNGIIGGIEKPMVIDADAIKATNLSSASNAILTPHKKELKILLKNSDIKFENKKNLQRYISTNVLILKDTVDTIISNKKIYYNETGNPGMTVGGTGDILAGLTSGFISQGNSLIDSACASTYLCGYIGDELYNEMDYNFIASDFLNKIGLTIKKLLQNS